MKRQLGIIVCIGVAILSVVSAHAQWVEVNGPFVLPYEGYIRSFVTLGSNIFAATDSGIFRSPDSGRSWTNVSSGLIDSTLNTAIVTSSSNLFIGTAQGVYRSSDNGGNWILAGLPAKNISSLAATGQYLYAAADSEFFRSSNNGAAWTPLPISFSITCLAASGKNVFAGNGGNEIMQSSDFGVTWHSSFSSGSNGIIEVLAASGDTICAGSKYDTPFHQDPGGEIFISSDAGMTWGSNSPFVSVWDYARSFAFTSGTITLGSSAGIFRTTNAGRDWITIDQGTPSFSAYGTFPLTALGVIGNDVIASIMDYGIYHWYGKDSTWNKISNYNYYIPIPDRCFSGIAAHDSVLVVLTCSGNLYRTVNAGNQWQLVTNLPITGDTGYSSLTYYEGKFFAGTDSGLAISTDLGLTWQSKQMDGSSIMPIIISNNRMIAGGQGVFVSSDGGMNWTSLLGRPPGDVRSIAELGNHLFTTTEDGLFVSVNNGKHWDQVTVPLSQPVARISTVYASGANLFVSADMIYLSQDSGATWTTPTMDVSRGAQDVEEYAAFPGVLFAGLTYYGIEMSTDNGISWKNDTNFFPTSVLGFTTDPHYLFAAADYSYSSSTPGGIWRRKLSETGINAVQNPPTPDLPINIYPNPTTGIIIVHNAPANILHVTVSSTLGEIVFDLPHPNSPDFTLDLSKLPPGTYFARFSLANEVIMRKIVKE
jgi:photosystem II stability/assembly factor-like uncharacterized protein